MSKRVVDPRVAPLIEYWMERFDFGHYKWSVTPLAKALLKERWAECEWDHFERHVKFRFGETLELNDANLESVVVHECMHGVTQWAMLGPIGSVMDEGICNMMARLFVPEAEHPFPYIKPRKGKRTAMAKFLSDDEQDALQDVLPHLIVRLPEPERATLITLFYDGKSLRDAAKDAGVHHKTIERRRDSGLTMLREMMLDGTPS